MAFNDVHEDPIAAAGLALQIEGVRADVNRRDKRTAFLRIALTNRRIAGLSLNHIGPVMVCSPTEHFPDR